MIFVSFPPDWAPALNQTDLDDLPTWQKRNLRFLSADCREEERARDLKRRATAGDLKEKKKGLPHPGRQAPGRPRCNSRGRSSCTLLCLSQSACSPCRRPSAPRCSGDPRSGSPQSRVAGSPGCCSTWLKKTKRMKAREGGA